MKQTAQVIRVVQPGVVEVKVRRASACASAHNCGSCDHCSFLENAPEIVVKAQDSHGSGVGDTVTVESSTAGVLGAAALLYLATFALFFAGYFLGGALGWGEGACILLGGAGFALGLLGTVALDRYRKKHAPVTYRVTSVEG